jgi:dihydrofolate reductase
MKMSMPKISMVAAMANNRVIGKDNKMPWHMPADLKHFKKVTMGKPVVMGRKTYDSIGMLLPGRENVIVTRDTAYQVAGATIVHSLEQAIEHLCAVEEIMIIGGSNIYTQMLEKADTLYLTFIDLDVAGDACFPDWGDGWQESESESHLADEKNPHNYRFVTLNRT